MQVKLGAFCGIFLFFFITINTFALQQESTKLPKNLSMINYPGKSAVTESIKQLYLTSDSNDAYLLSIPLIASAQQGDKKIYATVLEKIQIALNKMPNDYFKAWILGRVLLAADSMGDKPTLAMMKSQLKLILAVPFNKPFADIDYAFYAWAFGYLALLNKHEYKIIQSQLLESAQNLTTVYYQTRTHDALSNAVWAWVLDLQAASYANDKPTYFYILNQIKLITNKSTINEALTDAFVRTDTSSDYPAWGMGIVKLSASTIQDQLLHNELKSALKLSIDEAKKWGSQANQTPENQWKAKAEATLGELNRVLSEARLGYQQDS